MDQDQLLNLRAKIVDSALDLILKGTGEPSERFTFLLSIIRTGRSDKALLTKAYELASSIEDEDTRLSALLDLLDEVQFDIDRNGSDEDETPVAPSDPAREQYASQADTDQTS